MGVKRGMPGRPIALWALIIGSALAIGVAASLWPADAAHLAPTWTLLSRQIRVFPSFQPYIQQIDIYQSDADVIFAWHAIARQYSVTPAGGVGPENACVVLSKTLNRFFVRYTLNVTLCVVEGGTRMFFQRTLSFGY